MRIYFRLIIALLVGYLMYCLIDPSFPFLYESGVGKRAIVIGATAGMGRETARLLMQDGYCVGCVGRRQARLDELKSEFGERCLPCMIDMGSDKAIEQLEHLIQKMGGCDLMVVCISASADRSREVHNSLRESERRAIQVDLLGFWRAATVAVEHFNKQKAGHLVGVSSILGVVPVGCPDYSGSKAFMQRYMEALRNQYEQKALSIQVTDIVPGYVAVEWEPSGESFWEADVKTAGRQIFDAIKSRKKTAYITKRWRFVAWLWRVMPDWLFSVLIKNGPA